VAIVARADDGGRVGRQTAEVLDDRQVAVDRLGGLEKRPQRDGRHPLARRDQLKGGLEDLLVQRIEEVMRLKEARHPIECLVVDEDGAEQACSALRLCGARP
jgi:hypothetical protein